MEQKEKASDVLEYKINEFLKNLTHEQLSRDMISEVMRLLDLTNYLEKMADHGEKIVILLKKARAEKAFDASDQEHLTEMGLQVKTILKEMRGLILNYNLDKQVSLTQAQKREDALNQLRHQLREEKTSRAFTQAQISPTSLTLYTDILTSFEKMGDYAFNVVETITGTRKH